MSSLHENQKTIRQLKLLSDENKPKNEEAIFYFILGYPRSDIGKGTLTAQLLRTVSESDAIKFDGPHLATTTLVFTSHLTRDARGDKTIIY